MMSPFVFPLAPPQFECPGNFEQPIEPGLLPVESGQGHIRTPLFSKGIRQLKLIVDENEGRTILFPFATLTGSTEKFYPVELRRVTAWGEVDGELR